MSKILTFDSFINEEAGAFNVPYQNFDALTDEMLKYAKTVLNKKGFNAYQSPKSSAGIDWTWFQGNPLEKRPVKNPKFILSGWHGSSSYGKGKIITAIYVDNLPSQSSMSQILEWDLPFKNDPISNSMMTYFTTESFSDYKRFLEEVKKKIDETPKLIEQ